VSRITRSAPAFTLIEMLAVIAIIGVLAGLIFPVVGSVKKHQYISHTQAEMAQLETAIDRYKATYGFYPPDNPGNLTNMLINQLYYELVGTTNDGTYYRTLDGNAQIKITDVLKAFNGVGGFMNCSKPGGGEDASVARNFLPELRPKQVWKNYTNNTVLVNMLICSVGGPDSRYAPLNSRDLNPWRYNSSNPTNNPGSYDLWIQLCFGSQTISGNVVMTNFNLICNWTKQVQINAPLP
jgi:prepilin-type N-terminal cleavage/methylation domain-containing protein